MRRRAFVAVALAALVAAGCGGSKTDSATPKRKVIGVSLLRQSDAFYKDLEAGVRAEAAAKGFDLVVVACETDPTKQASQIEDFVAQHVAAILAAPCDSAAIVPSLTAPERAGIPVFTVDISAHGGKVVSHIASDNVLGGRLAGDALAGFLGGKGKVLIIDQPTVASVQDRVRGFRESLAKYPGMTVVADLNGDGNRVSAAKVMEDTLQAHHDLSGVFGINDDTALAAAGIIEAAGRKDIAVVGYDATDEAQTAIRKGGPLKADVIQYPRKMGQMAIDVIARFLAGEQVPALVSVDVGTVDAKTLLVK